MPRGAQPLPHIIQRVRSLTDISSRPSVTFSIPHKSSSLSPSTASTTGNTTPSSTSVSSGILSSMTPLTSSSSSQPNPPMLPSNTHVTQHAKTPAELPVLGEKGSPPKFRGSYEEVKSSFNVIIK